MEVKITQLKAGNEDEGYRTMWRVVEAADPDNHITPNIFATEEEAEAFAKQNSLKIVK